MSSLPDHEDHYASVQHNQDNQGTPTAEPVLQYAKVDKTKKKRHVSSLILHFFPALSMHPLLNAVNVHVVLYNFELGHQFYISIYAITNLPSGSAVIEISQLNVVRDKMELTTMLSLGGLPWDIPFVAYTFLVNTIV